MQILINKIFMSKYHIRFFLYFSALFSSNKFKIKINKLLKLFNFVVKMIGFFLETLINLKKIKM